MRFLILILLLTSSLLSASISSAASHETELQNQAAPPNIDPFEKVNRAIYGFNTHVDRSILKPLTKGYKKILPPFARQGIGNFFANLLEPTTVVNSLLQGKPKQATKSFARFLVNSTAGVLGVFDVASSIDSPANLPKHREDFGQTFAVWGVAPGPYIILPFLGPSNLRDFSGTLARYASTDVSRVRNLHADNVTGLTALRVIDLRARLLSFDETIDLQVDPYAFIRDSYAQTRLEAIHDGVLPESEEDKFEADLFDN